MTAEREVVRYGTSGWLEAGQPPWPWPDCVDRLFVEKETHCRKANEQLRMQHRFDVAAAEPGWWNSECTWYEAGFHRCLGRRADVPESRDRQLRHPTMLRSLHDWT